MPERTPPRERRGLTRLPSDTAVLIVLAAAGLIGAFMQTIVTPVIPDLPKLLNTTTADASWVLTSTLLAAAISTPITGRLGDMYGKRRVHLILLAVLVAGSLVSAVSTTLVPMIVGRSLQGVGLGVIPLGISILRDSVTRSSRHRIRPLSPRRLGLAMQQ
jgi:MFS family permease